MLPSDDHKLDNRPASRAARRVSSPTDEVLVKIIPLGDVCRLCSAGWKPDQIANRVARRQLNLITTQQLQAAGISGTMIFDRRARAILHSVHRGVYLYGTDKLLPGAAELAAVLACGPEAWARRRSALSLLRVIPPWPGDVEITVLRSRVSRAGIVVRRPAALPEVDQGFADGIPVVAPALALLEFAAVAEGDRLERAIAEAYFLRLVTESQLRAVLERHPGTTGVAALRAELARIGGPQWTESEGERRMKLLLRQAGLPMPVTRLTVAGFKADFCWPALRLIVEFDGYQAHGHRYAFERDRRRDQAHIAAGYTVIRFTWRQVEQEPFRVVAVIATAIAAATRSA
jgi:very-short-patch-repair endonuclease